MNLLEYLKQLEAEATPGPWEFKANPTPGEYSDNFSGDCTYKVYPKGGDYWSYFISDEPYYNTAPKKPDAELLVAIRNALPKFLAVVEAAKDLNWRNTHQNWQKLSEALTALEEDV